MTARLLGLLALFTGLACAQVTIPSMRPLLASNPACMITTTILPDGSVGRAYSVSLMTIGCTAPVTWDVSAGSLCGGVSLGSSGILNGIPTTQQTCSFTVRATDSGSNVVTQELSLTITPLRGASPVCKGCVIR